VVNEHTHPLPVNAYVNKFARVRHGGGNVCVGVDLAAWEHCATGLAVAAVMAESKRKNGGELTLDFVSKVLDEHWACANLLGDLRLLKSFVDAVSAAFARHDATTTLCFFAELREEGEKKTPKIPRDLGPIDEKRFAILNGMLTKKRLNLNGAADWFRECCRGPEGKDFCALGVAVQWLAVQRVCRGMGELLPCEADSCIQLFFARLRVSAVPRWRRLPLVR
jgi:hypothetical protein